MKSKVFKWLERRAAARAGTFGKTKGGGKNHKHNTLVMRVPEEALDELDMVLEEWIIRTKDNNSPRYQRARELLADLLRVLDSKQH